MPFWRNNLSGVCTENNREIHFTKWVPWHPYQLFLLLAVECGVHQPPCLTVSKVCSHGGLRWGYSPYGYLQAHGYTYCKTVLHTRCKPITEGNLALWGGGVKKTVPSRYLFGVHLSFHPSSLWYTVHQFVCYYGGQNGDAHFPLCGLASLVAISVCLFTAGLRTIPLRRIVVNT